MTKPVKASRLFDALIDVLAENAAPARPAAPATEGEKLADRHPLRVLVAEDNGVNQKVALAMLRHLGYRADLAGDGLEAVEAVRRVPYDVVFMDLQMPELDGVGATKRIIAEHPPGRRPRIIALTANAFDEDREACGRHGRLRQQAAQDRDAGSRAHARRAHQRVIACASACRGN